uniref:Protein kinase domain-containing protein n=1 Tax=Leersia perrieri TaxID=77586 RepID=A0A0D9WZ10_9ORYZ
MADWYEKLSQSFRESAKEVLARADIDPNVRCFTRKQMKRITNNYGTVLGKGGFSVVYNGKLDNGHPVAVKQYNWRTQKKEFTKEVIIQSQCSHKNIVRLLGCCVDTDTPMLVTEFVPNGNLSDLLHGNNDQLPVSLKTRFQIALDVADALVYMHYSQNNPILHGDIKSSNILLGGKHVAKLCDFGISRLLCMDNDEYTGFVIGSRGYMDPVYCETGRLSPKCDVYSFGVVLLELITRKKGIDDQNRSLVGMFACSSRDKRHELFDNEIATDDNMDFIQGIVNLALDCLKSEIEDRPQMKEVLEQLCSLKRRSEILRQERAIAGLRQSWMREIEAKLQRSGFKNFLTKTRIDAIKADPNQLSTSKTFSGRSTAECAMAKVYTGHFQEDNPLVVIKISDEVDEGSKRRLIHQMIMESRFVHRNVAKLVGCCLDHVDAPVLVYEYGVMNLHDALFGGKLFDPSYFQCELRLEIALGAALGLLHLHRSDVIHGDVRTANILLDVDYRTHKFTAKIDGYGITKFLTKAQYARFLTENICYKDPELLKTGVMTKENDVYGFGLVLLELFTQEKIETTNDLNTLLEIKRGFDAVATYHVEEIKKLASDCLVPEATERPSMATVGDRIHTLLRDVIRVHCLLCNPALRVLFSHAYPSFQ